MPDHILQLKSGKVISYDDDGTRPVNIKLWTDTDISIKSLTEDEILEFTEKFATKDIKDVEK